MKHTNDIFVSVNPNSPRKRRRKKSNSHGNVINFRSASELDSPRHIPDENQPHPALGRPWAPVTSFRTWEPSKKAGSNVPNTPTHSTDPPSSSAPSESPPVLLTLRNTVNNLGQRLETSRLHVYESPSLTPPTPSLWGDCKQTVLKAIADARRSPLDLIIDILDSSQDEYEHYRSQWLSPSCNKLASS